LTTSSGKLLPHLCERSVSHDCLKRADGYGTRFGVTYVNYATQERFPKDSGKFLVKVGCILTTSKGTDDS
jgi:hypothetical protein